MNPLSTLTQRNTSIMKTQFALILSCWLIFGAWTSPTESSEASLWLTIENVQAPQGIIWVGIYDSESTYLIKEKAIISRFDVNNTGDVQLEIPELSYGTYAIALFHDINNNGELDRSFVGIPKEPYAFSKRPKSKLRLPKFDEIKFDFNPNHRSLSTKLEKWWD